PPWHRGTASGGNCNWCPPAPQRERARRLIAGGRLRDTARNEAGLRILRDVEEVLAAEDVVALLVPGIERAHVYHDLEPVRGGVEAHCEGFEAALIFGAGLGKPIRERAMRRNQGER